MIETLFSGAFAPFTLSLALLFGLLALEIVFLLMGGTLFGVEGDADLSPDVDLSDLADLPEMDLGVDLDGFDIDPGEFDLPDAEAFAQTEVAVAPGGWVHWLGLGGVPGLIWLACLFMSFGVSGVVIQSALSAIIAPLPGWLAAIPAAALAIAFTRQFAYVFARLLPKTESQSVKTSQLGRRAGTVTQGTARRGSPAEVRVSDRYGNTHYIRAEPFQDTDEIAQGARVLVLRHRPSGGFRLISLDA